MLAVSIDTRSAAQHWAATWRGAWPDRDAERVVALYAEDAVHSSAPFRDPYRGRTAILQYFLEAFASETEPARVWFGEPLIAGPDDAPVAVGEWWAQTVDTDGPATLAGCSFLLFDPEGLLVRQCDYWHQAAGHARPVTAAGQAGWDEAGVRRADGRREPTGGGLR